MGNKKLKNRLSVVMVFCLFSIFLGTVFWGCSMHSGRSYTKDGKDYGAVAGAFRHRWWNFYERGLSYVEGEFYQKALTDLKEAVKQRDKDQRMARTYGMHFIDYFPHRELGVVYYSMGNMREAEKELETSINQFPTSKASYYLDYVRKALIKQEGQVIEPPKVSLAQKEPELRTKDDPVIISGLARDENYVSGIQINQIPLFIEGTRKEIDFKKELELSQGDHVIEIIVKNLPGKITKQ